MIAADLKLVAMVGMIDPPAPEKQPFTGLDTGHRSDHCHKVVLPGNLQAADGEPRLFGAVDEPLDFPSSCSWPTILGPDYTLPFASTGRRQRIVGRKTIGTLQATPAGVWGGWSPPEAVSPSPFLNRHQKLQYSWAVDLDATG